MTAPYLVDGSMCSFREHGIFNNINQVSYPVRCDGVRKGLHSGIFFMAPAELRAKIVDVVSARNQETTMGAVMEDATKLELLASALMGLAESVFDGILEHWEARVRPLRSAEKALNSAASRGKPVSMGTNEEDDRIKAMQLVALKLQSRYKAEAGGMSESTSSTNHAAEKKKQPQEPAKREKDRELKHQKEEGKEKEREQKLEHAKKQREREEAPKHLGGVPLTFGRATSALIEAFPGLSGNQGERRRHIGAFPPFTSGDGSNPQQRLSLLTLYWNEFVESMTGGGTNEEKENRGLEAIIPAHLLSIYLNGYPSKFCTAVRGITGDDLHTALDVFGSVSRILMHLSASNDESYKYVVHVATKGQSTKPLEANKSDKVYRHITSGGRPSLSGPGASEPLSSGGQSSRSEEHALRAKLAAHVDAILSKGNTGQNNVQGQAGPNNDHNNHNNHNNHNDNNKSRRNSRRQKRRRNSAGPGEVTGPGEFNTNDNINTSKKRQRRSMEYWLNQEGLLAQNCTYPIQICTKCGRWAYHKTWVECPYPRYVPSGNFTKGHYPLNCYPKDDQAAAQLLEEEEAASKRTFQLGSEANFKETSDQYLMREPIFRTVWLGTTDQNNDECPM